MTPVGLVGSYRTESAWSGFRVTMSITLHWPNLGPWLQDSRSTRMPLHKCFDRNLTVTIEENF
jgi:hypothetical protein